MRENDFSKPCVGTSNGRTIQNKHQRLNDPARGLAETLEKHTPGDIAYGITGKKINYDNPMKGAGRESRAASHSIAYHCSSHVFCRSGSFEIVT